MRPTCALSYAARVGFRANDSDPRHAPGEIARVRPLLRPADPVQGRCLVAAHCPHCQTRRFSRGVILIGALFVTARNAMKYIIRFNEAAPDRTLAPPELRTLLAPRALDKRLRMNQPKQTRFNTRKLPVLQPVLQYIPLPGDICVPWSVSRLLSC